MATEVAYYTYIYAKVERDKYQQVTGFTKAAVLCARFLAGVVAQLLVSFHLMDLRQLNYISLGCELRVMPTFYHTINDNNEHSLATNCSANNLLSMGNITSCC